MNKIEGFSKVWDNGCTSNATLSIEEIERFKQETGLKKVIGVPRIDINSHPEDGYLNLPP